MQGYEDPLNRRTYPWGREDAALLAWYRRLGQVRRERPSLQTGRLRYLFAQGGGLVLERRAERDVTVAALNAGEEALELTLPWMGAVATDAMSGQQFLAVEGRVHLTLPALGGVLLV